MKNIVVLYCVCADAFEADRIFGKTFGGISAFSIVLNWAKNNGAKTIVLTNGFTSEKMLSDLDLPIHDAEIVKKDFWTNADVIHAVADSCKKYDSEFALFTFGDVPFINDYLTKELVNIHTKYLAEYTFADGYPYGITPEVIDSGCAAILAALSDDVQKEAGAKKACRDGIFSIMKGDINSFEIETMLSEEDYRMLRLDFSCTEKINFEVCKNAYEIAKNTESVGEAFARGKTESLLSGANLIKTVPAFYNIQISSKNNHNIVYNPSLKNGVSDMNIGDFKKIVGMISSFSEKAVISLSCFGEPLLHSNILEFIEEVCKYRKLSLLIETDGVLLTRELAQKISQLVSKNLTVIDWIVCLDAFDKVLYSKLHGCDEGDFDKALSSVSLLEEYFEGHVYPQMIRMKANEEQLEGFFRFWREKTSPSKGQLIIQKYNSFCGLLSDEKSADLSPLERNPCWHIRRDMVILCDGSVPLCRQNFMTSVGNVLDEGVESVWEKFNEVLENHINKIYSDNCRICDEFYTFNF